MDFSQAFKVFQLNILRQAGITVTPDQLGLKSDPIADLQAKNSESAFDNILSKMTGGALGGLKPPTPPTPPADATDAAAQAEYQQALVTWQQNSQIYNQRLMQMMVQQMQAIQQSIVASQRRQQDSGSSSSLSGTGLGIGGILSGDDI